MRRTIIIAAAAIIVACVSMPEAQAQFGGNIGRRGNRLNRFGGVGGFNNNGSTLFDLYRTGKIPVPPYYSLHPPVYYNGIDYQRYGRSPFAYPYTWWQQFGYGYNGGQPPFSGHGISAAGHGPPANCQPVTVTNPYATEAPVEEEIKTEIKKNPFARGNSLEDMDSSVALVANPYISPQVAANAKKRWAPQENQNPVVAAELTQLAVKE